MIRPTIEEIYRRIKSALTESLGESEARSAAGIILEDVRGITQKDLIVNPQRTVEPETEARINDIVSRIIKGEPVQYAVGTARFYGMDFKVDKNVLIPRPETEGLIDLIVDRFRVRHDLSILDCGTGSGCIAIALARSLPFARVTAIDISSNALEIAAENAQRLKTSVEFRKSDILALPKTDTDLYDIIVSNPPYIAPDEASCIDNRVLDYEPHSALFVPKEDPLLFYRAIAEYGRHALKADGKIYFEINPRFAGDLIELLRNAGYADVVILRDYIGSKRYAVASK